MSQPGSMAFIIHLTKRLVLVASDSQVKACQVSYEDNIFSS